MLARSASDGAALGPRPAPRARVGVFGIGLASAVFFDAVIIRCLLVPALMEIFGRRAWWLPSWRDRRLPRLAIEAPHERHPAASGKPVTETI